MATDFPTSVDALTNPVSNDSLNSPSHSLQHTNANDAIEAIETYLISGTAPRGVVSYVVNTVAALTLTTTAETGFFTAPTFTPVAGRLYEFTYSIGSLIKTTTAGNINIRLRKYSLAGATISAGLFSTVTAGMGGSFTKTQIGSLGSTAFVPFLTVEATTNGLTASNATYDGCIIIRDIGLA
jgi:hypothetical protein